MGDISPFLAHAPGAQSQGGGIALTDAQKKRIEANKRHALAKLATTADPSRSSPDPTSVPGTTIVSAESQPPTEPPAKKSRGRGGGPGSKLSSGYCEYDLTDMVDSRGGFLVPDAGGPDTSSQGRKMVKPTEKILVEDLQELRDREILPCWEKPNPRKSTWNNMMLYVREQVEIYAFKRWGGEEALDREFERRVNEKKERKAKKFQASLRDLRNRTRTSLWQKKEFNAIHEHEFGPTAVNPETGESEQTCTTCGIKVEVEEF
ncbi:DNA repair protein rad14 [Dimargaris cristalligena]|nr:DNA repair protein rad14 [Dimargaris cristalligena]